MRPKYLFVIAFLALLVMAAAQPGTAAESFVGPVALHLFSGPESGTTLGGISLNLLPLHSDSQDVWGHLARRFTVSALGIGTQIQPENVFLGVGFCLNPPPQQGIWGGVTYVPSKRAAGAYIGYQWPL